MYCSLSHLCTIDTLSNTQEPNEIRFGNAVYVNRMSGRKRSKVQTYKKFYYVPILDTLRALLNTCYITEILNPHNSQTLCDGETFKTHPLFSTDPHAHRTSAQLREVAQLIHHR